MDFLGLRIAVYLMFVLLTCINFLIFTRVYSKNIIQGRSNIPLNIMEGLIYGLIIGITQTMFFFYSPGVTPWLLFTFPIFIIIRNWIVFLFSIPISFVFHWYYFNDFSNEFIIFFAILFLSSVIFWILSKFFKKSRLMQLFFIPWIWFVFGLFIFVISLIKSIDIRYAFVMEYAIPIIIVSLFIIVYYFIIRFLSSANSLVEANIYTYGKYHRVSTSEESFKTYLRDNKVNQGIFLVFSISEINNKELGFDTKKIEQERVLGSVFNEFEKYKPIFFKINENEYGFFISQNRKINYKLALENNNKQKRSNNDTFSKIEQDINELNLFLRQAKAFKHNYSFGACIYGIQEYDFQMAIKKACFALNLANVNSKNIITLFDSIYYNHFQKDNELIKKLNHQIQASYISSKILQLYRKDGKLSNLFLSVPYSSDSIEISAENIRSIANNMGMQAVLVRYLAAKSISLFSNKYKISKRQICIEYLAEIIASENFDIGIFVNLIEANNLSPSNVVLNLDLVELSKFKSDQQFASNLENIKKAGVGIAFLNCKHDNLYLINQLEPNFVVLTVHILKENFSEFSKKILEDKNRKFKIVVLDINSSLDYEYVNKLPIDLLYGNYRFNNI